MPKRPPLLWSANTSDTASPSRQIDPGPFNLSIHGVFDATVRLQRSFDGGQTWLDVSFFAGPTETVLHEAEGSSYRFHIGPGDLHGGTVNGRIGQ